MLQAKFEAALLAVGLALMVPIGIAAYVNPWLGATLTACCAGSAVSCTTLHLLHPNPGKRSEFNQRAKGQWTIGIAEFLLAAGWAATAAGTLALTPWTLIIAPLLLGLPALDRLLEWLDGEPAMAAA
jgi:hypothetical protein